ncbi:molybdate ABC transporter substrate-binding protein [Alkalicoccus luteus]|uniref:Molybdate ABC transporter substrate-binding protein n=1 Tax=Alkalicoccus luteus TaxID=1237094 RepID=A0A969TTD8_9BACI|nr:molybdate ABC transporter substrate-binding protein [Alkalicoccus luteus]NJP37553.1 molybdate ABC transporter substrate-binding protein [Alkalicoccus luteus]
MKRMFLWGVIPLLAACGEAQEEIHVAAASGLYHVLSDAGAVYESETGVAVTFSFGATGQLTQQIEQGADFELFLAGDESYIERLEEGGYVTNRTRIAEGIVTLLSADGSGPFESLDDLTEDKLRIAMPNPEHAPYGRAAYEVLQTESVWEVLSESMIYANDVRTSLQYVESGEVDAGFAALSLMQESELFYVELDTELHEPIVQTAAIPVQSQKQEEAEQFLDYLRSDEVQDVFAEYGFLAGERES